MHKFNDAGTEVFARLLMSRDLNANDQTSLFVAMKSLREDPDYIVPLQGEVEVLPFRKREDLAKHLWSYFGDSGSISVANLGDPNLWNWLSAAWLEVLVSNHDMNSCRDCSKQGQNLSKLIGNFMRWSLTETSRRYHWHVVSHPFFVYQANQANFSAASAFLATDVLHPGDLVDKLGSNRRFIGAPVSELATLMYFDHQNSVLRTGISNRLGEVNQLSRFLNQVDRTVDFESMSVDDLIDFLPPNFSEWVGYAKAELGRGKVNAKG